MANLNTNAQYPSVTTAAQADSSNFSTQPTITSSTGTVSGQASASVSAAGSFKTITSYRGVGGTYAVSRNVQMPVFQNAPN